MQKTKAESHQKMENGISQPRYIGFLNSLITNITSTSEARLRTDSVRYKGLISDKSYKAEWGALETGVESPINEFGKIPEID